MATPSPQQPHDLHRVPTGLLGGLSARIGLIFLVMACALVVSILAMIQRVQEGELREEGVRLSFAVDAIARHHALIEDAAVQVARLLSHDPRILSGSTAQCDATLAQAVAGRASEFANIVVATADGQVLCSAVPGPKLPFTPDLRAVTQALTTGEPFVGEMVRGSVTGKWVMPVYAAMAPNAEDPPRVLVVGLDQSWLQSALPTTHFAVKRVVGLMGRGGTVLYRFPDPEGWAGRSAKQLPLYEGMRTLDFQGTMRNIGLDGVDRVFAFETYSHRSPQQIVLWVTEPVADVLAPTKRVAYWAGGAVGASLLLLLLVVWRMAKRAVLQPIDQLKLVADRVGNGDLTARVDPGGAVREVRALAETFNTMAESLGTMDRTVRSNRGLQVMLAVRGVHTQPDKESVLFTEICEAIVGCGDYPYAWIAVANHDEAKSVSIVGGAGVDLAALGSFQISWADVPWGRGPTGTAIRENRVVTQSEMPAPSPDNPWVKLTDQLGIRSAIALPLRDGEAVWGALTLFAKTTEAFADVEALLLSDTALDVEAKRRALAVGREKAVALQRLVASEQLVARGEAMAKMGSWQVDMRTGAIVGSAGFHALLEAEAGEFAGTALGLRAMIHPDDQALATANFEHALATRGELRSAYRVITARGRTRDVETRSAPHFDGEGNLTGISSTMRDVTEVRAAETKANRITRATQMLAAANAAVLHATEEASLLQATVDTLVDVGGYVMAWVGRAETDEAKSVTCLCYAGNGAEYTADLKVTWRDDIRGRGPTGRAVRTASTAVAQHIDTEPQFEPWREAALAHGYAASICLPMLPDSTHATMCLTAYAAQADAFDTEETKLLANMAENVAFGLTTLREAKARQAAEAALTKLSMAVEQSPESIAITDLEARLEYVNPAFLRITGYTRDELIGQNPRALQSGKTPPETYRAMWAKLTAGEVWQGEFINRRKDGSEYVDRATVAPIRQPDGAITHYLAVKDDITETRRMTDELADYRLHLESLVERRTEELAESQRRAEAANQAKSAFLANMSHEIRTPMNAIIGLTHLLEHGDPRPEQRDRLAKIGRSAQHLMAVINDILDLSKVEAGKMHIETAAFSLLGVIDVVRDNLGDRAHEKAVALDVHLGAGLPDVLSGDSVRLTQILLNLGSNAVKFTDQGSVTLNVRAIAGLPNTSDLRVRFEVKDTGIGMTPEQTSRMFDPFEQAEVATTRKYGGTGLGLAITRRLVDLMGGTLGVNSELGVGSTFWVELPFAQADADSVNPDRRAQRDPSVAVLAGVAPGQVRLLLVEDDEINQEVASELLRSQGFVVDIASNGVQALALAEANGYDAILMDVQMPVMGGLEATRALRARTSTAHTPVLAMTANAFADDKAACVEAGMDDFIAKPIEPERMFATIAAWTGAIIGGWGASGSDSTVMEVLDLRSHLAQVPGLIVTAGLRSVGGNQDKYVRLVRRFCEERVGALVAIRAEIAAERWTDARRGAHTLKGLAATIGAEGLRQSVADLEAILTHGSPAGTALQARLDEAEGILKRLVATLNEVLPSLPSPSLPAELPAPSPEQLAALAATLDQLQQFLAHDDLRALQLFRSQSTELRTVLGDREKELRQAIEAFDFERALGIVRLARES